MPLHLAWISPSSWLILSLKRKQPSRSSQRKSSWEIIDWDVGHVIVLPIHLNGILTKQNVKCEIVCFLNFENTAPLSSCFQCFFEKAAAIQIFVLLYDTAFLPFLWELGELFVLGILICLGCGCFLFLCSGHSEILFILEIQVLPFWRLPRISLLIISLPAASSPFQDVFIQITWNWSFKFFKKFFSHFSLLSLFALISKWRLWLFLPIHLVHFLILQHIFIS